MAHVIELWPFEAVLLQHFVPHNKTGFVPVDDFEFVLAFIAEDKHGITKRREFQLMLNDNQQPINTFTKIHMPTMQIDITRLDEHFHDCKPLSTCANQSAWILNGKRTSTSANAMAICSHFALR